jgi:KaiC/GvpD/RAD55 family RecA-like ATPase
MEKVKTGIVGLDDLLDGGIPKNNILLISGGAGTGKTIMSLQYIYNGAKLYNEPGVYVSTDQTEDEIRNQAKAFGWDLKDLEKKKMIRLMHIDITTVKDHEYLRKISAMIKSIKAKRLVLDSMTTLTEFLAPSEIKDNSKLFDMMGSVIPVSMTETMLAKNTIAKVIKQFKDTNCTAVVTSELPETTNWLSRDTVSEFLCDGVILLHYMALGEKDFSHLEVRKMRQTKHKRGTFELHFTPKGLEVKEEEKFG